MTSIEFLEEYYDYINRYNLFNPEGGESENDVRNTCETLLAAERLNLWIPYFETSLLNCVDLDNGVLKIHPGNDNQNAMDNYIPFFYALRKHLYARSLCLSGMEKWWWYQNKNQDESFISPYMGRFAAFRAMAKMSGGQKLNCLDIQLFKLAINTAIDNTEDDQDGRCLTTFMFNLASESPVFMNEPWFIDAKIRWKEDFKKYWPNGYGEVLKKYHGHETPNSRLLWGYFGK